MAYIVNRFRIQKKKLVTGMTPLNLILRICTYITTFHPDPSKRSTQFSLWSFRVEK